MSTESKAVVATNRLKVLISAYACEPGKGSEPYVGWNTALQVARYHEVWLLTRANNCDAIEAECKNKTIDNVHSVYFDLPRWATFWKKGRRGIHVYYYLWQIGAYFLGRRLHSAVHFDVVHHLTLGIDWMPSFLPFLPVPCVWGPIVGAQSAGTAFRRTFPWSARAQECVRAWVRGLSRYNPLMRWTARRTRVALAAGEYVRGQLRSLGCRTVEVYPSVGLSSSEIQRLSVLQKQNHNGNVRFLYVGNLCAFRGISLALKAFAQIHLRSPEIELWIVGDGPERQRLMRESEELGVSDAVKFWGLVPRHELLVRLTECNVLVYLCLRGAISMACLEAMAAGLPVICLDLGGTGLQVTEHTGIKMPAISPQQVARDLTDAMWRLAEDRDLRRRMGEAARKRVEDEFSWDVKGARMCEIYRQALTP
jgi:glycosyltransferase involved in cell wall biosynthesis